MAQVYLTKEALERAVKDYKRVKASEFKLRGALKPKQLKNAVRIFAPDIKESEVVALMDTTLFESGKDGFLITKTHMYGKTFGGKTIDLNRVSKINRSESHLKVTYPDGSSDELYTTIYDQDLFNFLKLVMDASSKLNESKPAEGIRDISGGKSAAFESIVDVSEPAAHAEPVNVPEEKPAVVEAAPAAAADKSADDFFSRGTALFMAKDYEGAKAAFRKAADLGHQKAAMFLKQLEAMAKE